MGTNLYNELLSYWHEFANWSKSTWNSASKQTRFLYKTMYDYFNLNKELIFKFISFIIIYGILIGLVALFLIGVPFWAGSILGFGILWYFVKQEMPSLFRDFRRAK